MSLVKIIFSLIVLLGITYCSYNFLTAENRIKSLCNEIPMGITFSELYLFTSENGLSEPHKKDGLNILVESKSMGRYGCEVLIENGKTTTSTYSHAS